MSIKIFDLNALATFSDWDSWFFNRVTKPKIPLKDNPFTRPLTDERFTPPLGRKIYITDGKEEMMIEQFRKWKSLNNRQRAYYAQINELQKQAVKMTEELGEVEREIIDQYTSPDSKYIAYIRVDGIEYNVTRNGINQIQFVELNKESNPGVAELDGIESDVTDYIKDIKDAK